MCLPVGWIIGEEMLETKYATDEDGQLSRPREVLVRTGWRVFLPGVVR